MKGVLKRFLIRVAILWPGAIAAILLVDLCCGRLTESSFTSIAYWVISPTSAPSITLIILTIFDIAIRVGALCERCGQTFWQLAGGGLRKRFGRLIPALGKPKGERLPRPPWWAR